MNFYTFSIDSETSKTNVLASEYETILTKTYIPLSDEKHVAVGFSITSSLYPEYVSDKYMGHCNWYIWESINKKKDVC